MKVDWPDDRCIICLGRPEQGKPKPMTEGTEAHVIPESLGGKLWAPFLCKQCNSDMGRLEGVLTKDVMILGLVDRLYDVLPSDLVNSIYRHAGYFADSEEFGRVYGRLNEMHNLTPEESETIRAEQNTLRQIEAALRRDGAGDASIKETLSEFAEAPDGARFDFVPGLTVVKGIPCRCARMEAHLRRTDRLAGGSSRHRLPLPRPLHWGPRVRCGSRTDARRTQTRDGRRRDAGERMAVQADAL